MAEQAFLAGVDLSGQNTLGVPSIAEFYREVGSLEQLHDAITHARRAGWPVHLLGGGSNVILAPEIPGLVLRPTFHGRRIAADQNQCLRVTAGAGEDWHDLVQSTLAQGYYGLENLALIPGTVGAAPVQNIGAYGVELEQIFAGLRAYDLVTGELRHFDRDACAFAYRDSRFKREGAGNRYVITEVTVTLTRTPAVNLGYPALAEALAEVARPQPEQVFEAVCRIRRQRLPMPEVVPNCGSFFKNPIVQAEQFRSLQHQYPQIAHFPLASGEVKLAAAWLIDRAGWKGREAHGVGVHARQALVLTNPRRLPAANVLRLAQDIQKDVHRLFGVPLELEPRLLGFPEKNL